MCVPALHVYEDWGETELNSLRGVVIDVIEKTEGRLVHPITTNA